MKNVTLVEHGDMHWYTSPDCKGKYLPSVSTILGTLKDGLEFVSAYDLKKAADRGTKVHLATEQLELGETLNRTYYDDTEWLMLLGFARWWHEYQPKRLFMETRMADFKLGYAGTCDRIYVIGGKTVLLDIKTSSAVQDKYWLQVAAYANLAVKMKLVKKIHATSILRLSAKTKSGYQYLEKDDFVADKKVFDSLFAVWSHMNPEKQPDILDLPEEIKLLEL